MEASLLMPMDSAPKDRWILVRTRGLWVTAEWSARGPAWYIPGYFDRRIYDPGGWIEMPEARI